MEKEVMKSEHFLPHVALHDGGWSPTCPFRDYSTEGHLDYALPPFFKPHVYVAL
jgi:hypothetical protein